MRKIGAKIISAVLIASMVLGSNGIVTFASEVEDPTEIAFDASEIETSETEEVAESEDAEDEVIIPEDEPVCEETSSEEAFEEELSEEIPESEDIEENLSDEEIEIEDELQDEEIETEEELSDEEIETEEELLEADGNEWGDDTDIAGSTNLSDDMLWRITADGTLIVKGKGEYPKSESNPYYPEWYDYNSEIVSAEIEVSDITSLEYFFYACWNMREVNLSKLDTSEVTNFASMFRTCSSLSTIDLTNFNTENATSFAYMFSECLNLLSLDLSKFTTSKVTTMEEMFSYCYRLTSLDLSSFDTSSVTSMTKMFLGSSGLISIDLSSFETGEVESFDSMFSGCDSLSSIDVSNFSTVNGKDFDSMFCWCENVTELDLSSFDTSSAKSFYGVFEYCRNLEKIKFPSAGLDLSGVSSLASMFSACWSLKEIDLSNFKVNDSVSLDGIFSDTFLYRIVLPLNHKNTLEWGLWEYNFCNLNGNLYSSGLDTSDIKNVTYVRRYFPYDASYRKFGTTDDIPEGLWVEGIPESTFYTGKAITFEVLVFNGNDILCEGIDYTISYKNNKNVNNPESSKKKPTVIIKGKGDYTGTYEFTFNILPVDIDSYQIEQCAETRITVNSKGVLPNPVLLNDTIPLKKGTDFTMSLYDAITGNVISKITKAGEYSVKLEGKGNYTGKLIYGLTAEEGLVDINKVKIKTFSSIGVQDFNDFREIIKEISYNGKPLEINNDYTFVYASPFNIGNNIFVIQGIGNYTGFKKITVKGTQSKMSNVTVEGLPSSVSTLWNIDWLAEQKASLTDKKTGDKLELYVDYSVDVKYDYAKKKATVCFKGINDYTGKITKTIKLNIVDISTNSDDVEIYFDSEVYTKNGFGSFVDFVFNLYYEDGEYDSFYAERGVDYTVSGKISKKDDEYEAKITVKGKGRFKGSRTATVELYRDNIRNGHIDAKDVKYSKKAGNYKTSLMVFDDYGFLLKSGKEYTNVTYRYVNKTTVINKGEELTRFAGSVADKNDIVPAKTVMKVTVEGMKYYYGDVTGIYTVNTGTVASAKVTVKAQTFTGSDIFLKPEDITVKDGKTALTYGKDYEIVPGSYYLNRFKGTAYVKIRGCGDYSGEKLVTFKIKAKLFDKFL